MHTREVFELPVMMAVGFHFGLVLSLVLDEVPGIRMLILTGLYIFAV